MDINVTWADEDITDLDYAKSLLENPSLAARIASAFGAPVEWVLTKLPDGVQNAINLATSSAIETALKFAVTTLEDRQQHASEWIHKTAVALSGAAGGLFGASALPIELPISTTIMLRAIADIARSEGERIATAVRKSRVLKSSLWVVDCRAMMVRTRRTMLLRLVWPRL